MKNEKINLRIKQSNNSYFVILIFAIWCGISNGRTIPKFVIFEIFLVFQIEKKSIPKIYNLEN